MSPAHPPYDMPNHPLGYAELRGKRCVGMRTGRMKAANLKNLVVMKFCLGIAFACGLFFCKPSCIAGTLWEYTNPTPLVPHVCVVVESSSEEQMVRIYTAPDVAFVTNEHSGRNFPVGNFPRDSVRSFAAENSIASVVGVPLPQPAFVLFFYKSPIFFYIHSLIIQEQES
jgi:hypothetical protein